MKFKSSWKFVSNNQVVGRGQFVVAFGFGVNNQLSLLLLVFEVFYYNQICSHILLPIPPLIL
jgi:hypothetical protein